jgi:NTE family protein
MKEASQKTLALALGGGSALGFAHIGFLQILEENNIKVSAIAGTSMGSLVGAFYAFGYTAKELEIISMKQIYARQFITDIAPITFLKNGFISGKKIQTVFDEYFEHKNIEDLKMPYKAVAVDMYTGKPYIYETGPLSQAVRTSISIPGVFKPVKKDDMLLVDGGIIDNVPCDVAKQFGTDVIISVDVIGDYELKAEPRTITGLLLATFTLIQQEYQKFKPTFSHLKIKMNVEGVSMTTFHKKAIKRAIKIGREYGEKHLNEIKALLF